MPRSHSLDVGVAVVAEAFSSSRVGEPTIYDKDTALVGLFTALIRRLQPLATALAMDLREVDRRASDRST